VIDARNSSDVHQTPSAADGQWKNFGSAMRALGLQSPIANVGGTPTTSFMRTIFAQSRAVLPSLNTPLPLGVSDVQITKVWITNATNAIHVKTGL